MKILMKIAANQPILLAILVAWIVLVTTAYDRDTNNNFIGTIALCADWIVQLVMLGSAESLPLVRLILLGGFPMFFFMIPAYIILNIRKNRSARHANP
ncbi:hypothetical protein F3I62_18995 [Pseudomonas sp. R-28-1W-6]|uniref:hypothetical protein n=1 Tax=Pseudomonas sp. R-28-1W-6 TaxID=2650101 RepID=UPI0013662DF4|nr:hypothetical protein [Pseudomonas sp. R-28-1W-6]MWV14193.1 hypothetical protein [Pseudomonas sp. R-28-1W-6]